MKTIIVMILISLLLFLFLALGKESFVEKTQKGFQKATVIVETVISESGKNQAVEE